MLKAIDFLKPSIIHLHFVDYVDCLLEHNDKQRLIKKQLHREY
jgi:hypothetical protein